MTEEEVGEEEEFPEEEWPEEEETPIEAFKGEGKKKANFKFLIAGLALFLLFFSFASTDERDFYYLKKTTINAGDVNGVSWDNLNLVVPWADENVANDITLDDLTQVTTRLYSDLQGLPYIPTEGDIDLNALAWDTNAETACDGNAVLTGDGLCQSITDFYLSGEGGTGDMNYADLNRHLVPYIGSKRDMNLTGNTTNINLNWGNDIQNFENIYGKQSYATGIYGGASLALGTGAAGTSGGSAKITIGSTVTSLSDQTFEPQIGSVVALGDPTHEFTNLYLLNDINSAGADNNIFVLGLWKLFVNNVEITGAGGGVADTTLDSNATAEASWLGKTHSFTVDQNYVNIGSSGSIFSDKNIFAGEQIVAGNGKATTPAFSFVSDRNTGIYRAGLNQLGFSAGGTRYAMLDSSGLSLKDSLSAYDGVIKFGGTTMTTSRTLTLNLGNADRTLALTGDVSLNQSLLTTSSPTFNSLTLTSINDGFLYDLASQDYLFTTRDNWFFAMQGQTSATQSSYEYYTKDGDGTDNINFIIWGEGLPTGIANSSYQQFGLISAAAAANRYYKLHTSTVGSGNAYPLVLYTGANTNQVKLDTNGDVLMVGTYSDTVGATNRDLYIDSLGKLGYVSSSARYKENIRDLNGSERIYDLKPVLFDRADGTAKDEVGLIAEEVLKAYPELVSFEQIPVYGECPSAVVEGETEPCITHWEQTDRPETVNYSQLVVPLLKELQALKAENEALKLAFCKHYPLELVCIGKA